MKKEFDLRKKVRALSALTRWGEIWDFCLILTLVGVIASGVSLQISFISIFLANFTGLCFAFMINDIEDAEDDFQNEKKRLRNPISNEAISKEEGYIYSIFMLIISLLFYLYSSTLANNILPFLFGVSIILISFFYSYKKVRLKNIPVIDLLSHSYILAGGQFLATFFCYFLITSGNNLPIGFYFLFVLMLMSMYGQLENEVRDYETDKKVGMKTLAVKLGIRVSQILQVILIFLSIGLSLYILVNIQFPIMLFVQGLIVFFILLIYPLFRNFVYKDKRLFKNDLHRIVMLSIIATLLMYLLNLYLVRF